MFFCIPGSATATAATMATATASANTTSIATASLGQLGQEENARLTYQVPLPRIFSMLNEFVILKLHMP